DDATASELPLVFSAGNLGGNASTLTSPKEAKNVIVVGASCGARSEGLPTDNVDSVAGFSSRGPTSDGRICPHVVAPGTDVVGARPQQQYPLFEELLPAFTDDGGSTHPGHLLQEGTSPAAPHVSGLLALYIEWWQTNHAGKTPSPAMLKALLVNGARDMGGGENWRVQRDWTYDYMGVSSLPNRYKSIDLAGVPDEVVESYWDETAETFEHVVLTQVASQDALTGDGMWAVDTSTASAPVLYVRSSLGSQSVKQSMSPKTNLDRSRIMYRDSDGLGHIPNNDQGWGRPGLKTVLLQDPAGDRGPKICFDQQHAFDTILQEFTVRVAPKYTDRPLRVTLTWTDAAAAPDDADVLTNDLNLEVIEESTSQTYWGNVFDAATGFSTAGGAADGTDNLECVYIENPSGTYEINVVAWVLTEDARHAGTPGNPWQDFALVVDNAELASASPAAVVPVVDRSGSMVTSGYVDVTRAATRQFVDLMEVDDQLGVVSFGTSATVEYSDAAGTGLETITGDTERVAAQNAVDQINFSGSTYMGGGIAAAKALLPPSTAGAERSLVLLSDGYDNQGNDNTNTTALQAAADAPVV
ncbi:MAG: S8 family serine peptidase, partial [Myxococcota bacterium]|nr:S8 family serine peptidase [Myxococcota bacterium]